MKTKPPMRSVREPYAEAVGSEGIHVCSVVGCVIRASERLIDGQELLSYLGSFMSDLSL